MAVDLIAALQSTATILPALNSILANLRTKREIKSGELESMIKDFESILDKLDRVGSIGPLLDDYTNYYLGSYIIYMTSDKLSEQINIYRTQLERKDDLYWGIIENSFQDVKNGKSDFFNVVLDRVEYLDTRDKIQVPIKVNDLYAEYIKAQSYFEMQNSAEFKRCVNNIKEKSRELHSVFKSGIKSMINTTMCLKRA